MAANARMTTEYFRHYYLSTFIYIIIYISSQQLVPGNPKTGKFGGGYFARRYYADHIHSGKKQRSGVCMYVCQSVCLSLCRHPYK